MALLELNWLSTTLGLAFQSSIIYSWLFVQFYDKALCKLQKNIVDKIHYAPLKSYSLAYFCKIVHLVLAYFLETELATLPVPTVPPNRELEYDVSASGLVVDSTSTFHHRRRRHGRRGRRPQRRRGPARKPTRSL